MGKIFVKCGRVFLGTLLIVLIICLFSVSFFEKVSEKALAAEKSGAICMSADTGEIFFAKNEDLRLPMASTTKIMTALLVIENCLPSEVVTVTEKTVGVDGSSIYLKAGDRLTVEELLYGLMLRSGNDAAETLADYCAGSIDNFVEMMNERAAQLGLRNTHFANPHGLHDPDHYTSAYDLCALSCYAMRNERFRKIVSTQFITVGVGENKRYWSNKNKILHTFSGGNGIKTGYTKDAGRCLVASATREGKTVVSVVLNRPDMFAACEKMMEEAFSVLSAR